MVHEKDPWIEDPSWNTIEEEVPDIVVDKKSRRKSWHAIKFERKRRKGVVEPGSPPEARQKRPSWWNIFGGQPWPRYTEVLHVHGELSIRTAPISIDTDCCGGEEFRQSMVLDFFRFDLILDLSSLQSDKSGSLYLAWFILMVILPNEF